MKVEFEWQISDLTPEGWVYVRERLVGSDLLNTFGPMPQWLGPSFVRARRNFVHETITTRTQAVQIFEPRAPIIIRQGDNNDDN